MLTHLRGYFDGLSKWLSRRTPLTLAGIVLCAYLATSAALVAIQAIAPGLQSPAEIVLGLLALGVVIVCLRHAWQSTPAPGHDQRAARRWLLVVIVLSLLFQIGHWYADGGSLSAKLGDDDELYIFLAQQIAGQIDGPPLFTFRTPGLPLLISATLRIFGGTNLWTFSLVQRLLLAAIPPLLYLVLRDWLPLPFAALGSLFFLFTQINEHKASFALSELPYTFGTALSIAALVVGLKHNGVRRAVWIGVAALALACKTLLRPTGVAAAAALAIALLLAAVDLKPLRRLGLALLLVVPTALAAGGLVLYNQHTAGVASLSDLGGLNVIIHFGPRVLPLRESPERAYFEALLPEIDPDVMFTLPLDWYTARYRAALQGPDRLAEFSAMSNALAAQIAGEHKTAFLGWMLQKAYTDLMYPRLEVIPITWYRPELREKPPRSAYDPPTRQCNVQSVAPVELLDDVCAQSARARAAAAFEPALPALPGPVTRLIYLLTVSLPFRLRLLLWVFVWGLSGLVGICWLVAVPDTRPIGWLLGGAFAAEFIPLVLIAAVSTQYQILYQPLFMLATWIALGQIARRPAKA